MCCAMRRRPVHSSSAASSPRSRSRRARRLNHDRYRSFYQNAAKQCALAFDGPAYRGLDASSLDAHELDFAQAHLRILSGLYGVLRPLDVVKPYRLEMGCKLENPKGKDLYAFWGDDITRAVVEDLAALPPEQRFVVNCASQARRERVFFLRF